MRSIFLCSVLLLLLVPKTEAVDKHKYLSEPNAVFCMSFSDITKLKTFTAQGDKYTTAKLFERGDCAIVKPPLAVFIVQDKGKLVRVRRAGMTESLWTFRDGLR